MFRETGPLLPPDEEMPGWRFYVIVSLGVVFMALTASKFGALPTSNAIVITDEDSQH